MQNNNKHYLYVIFVVGLALNVGACSSIVEGTSQEIRVNTNPSEANCTLTRDGRVLGAIPKTPGQIRVDKNSNAIRVDCEKSGYQPATQWVESEFAAATVGNLLIGGVVGVVIDHASGAARKYSEEVNLALARPGEAPPPAPAPSLPQGIHHSPTPANKAVAAPTPAPSPAVSPPAVASVSTPAATQTPPPVAAATPLQSLSPSPTTDPTPTPTRVVAPARTVTPEARLRSLQDMLDRKAITQREYETKRAAILSGQ